MQDLNTPGTTLIPRLHGADTQVSYGFTDAYAYRVVEIARDLGAIVNGQYEGSGCPYVREWQPEGQTVWNIAVWWTAGTLRYVASARTVVPLLTEFTDGEPLS